MSDPRDRPDSWAYGITPPRKHDWLVRMLALDEPKPAPRYTVTVELHPTREERRRRRRRRGGSAADRRRLRRWTDRKAVVFHDCWLEAVVNDDGTTTWTIVGPGSVP